MKVKVSMLSETSLPQKDKHHINSHMQSLYLKTERHKKGREILETERKSVEGENKRGNGECICLKSMS